MRGREKEEEKRKGRSGQKETRHDKAIRAKEGSYGKGLACFLQRPTNNLLLGSI
jgi:hypothetical protein